MYFTSTNVSTGAGGDDRIGTTTEPSLFTINYTGNQSPSQSGLTTAVSMFRINSPGNGNQQIRARHFENDWIWGSGTFDRADMIFTFSEIEEARINPEADGFLLPTGQPSGHPCYYNLQGIALPAPPSRGLYIERDGSTTKLLTR